MQALKTLFTSVSFTQEMENKSTKVKIRKNTYF